MLQLLLALSLSIAPPNYAALVNDYYPVSADDDSLWFVERDSVVEGRGNSRTNKVWVRSLDREDMSDSTVLMTVDCVAEKSRTTFIRIEYFERDEVVTASEPGEWIPFVPGSHMAAIGKLVCGDALPTDWANPTFFAGG